MGVREAGKMPETTNEELSLVLARALVSWSLALLVLVGGHVDE